MVVEQGKSEQAPNWAIHQKRGGNIHCTNKKDWEKAPEQQDNTKEWKTLKESVLKKNHYECSECKKEGRVVKADTVHHVMKVREYPRLALSEYYVAADRTTRNNLILF